ncbi:MAG TPA: Gfo/Idh/MocA family oxidoreductase [Pseudonocardia sp.]|uniref:Gfo/Idh/MocA family protein n=1 Tax=Pseudonocardia sp. TaxID=60912 RepID=UPI002CD41715|nr:Gfo/Idh/MocA family oxidoreductase [Pseudonocardia sp.]HTF46191.1 Gfo/Idh/MocA family oxidoreductase [Pseudonocardia sp.]
MTNPATRARTGRARIGIVGLGQGRHLARWATRAGLEVVAGCDLDRARLEAAEEVPTRSHNWADLLDLGLDGVVLADDFDTHAPLAIAFLERGVHVLSETAACTSEAEGSRLIAAADASRASYSFAENYVCLPHVRLIRDLVDHHEIGQVELIEADYLHGLPGTASSRESPTATGAGSRSGETAAWSRTCEHQARTLGPCESGASRGPAWAARLETRSSFRRPWCLPASG